MHSCFVVISFGLPVALWLVTIRRCSGLSADDVWSGSIWEKAQRARDKNASNSDRLMQHIWQNPETADKFIDCDILADSETDKYFQFLTLYDADDAREDLLNALPDDGYVRGPWPLKDGVSIIPYTIPTKMDTTQLAYFIGAFRRWQKAASVDFVKGSKDKPHLEVMEGGGCYATLGYHPTLPRQLSVHAGRCTETIIVHLLGHVLGLPHPTSTVGRANEQYLMPHHAAPRSMGVLRTRAGTAFDPFDVMAVDPWFCGVFNRSTWRPLSPIRYKWAAVTGHWALTGYENPERRSASTGLLQREIQRLAGKDGCTNQCSDPCRQFLTPKCECVTPYEATDDAYVKLAKAEGLWHLDMAAQVNKDLTPDSLKFRLVPSPKILMFFHTTNEAHFVTEDVDGTKCWQCTLFVVTVYLYASMEPPASRLVALGSRCSLFSMEVNGALEEGWFRLCMHHLLQSEGRYIYMAFRGPGTVLIRYFGSEDQFPEFHKHFTDEIRFGWSVQKMKDCKCSDGPAVEIQSSMIKQ
ncbi:uncharacterized protein LOC122365505 [Amphibalanus amphitrite]|uniref:uncharacterized protein LOC122365505 n=1 Tax=Amphibalanus amphitrite TaxID=1232801 RepID=UPI001C923722|nr:uncharacterized protein LOC122365505 [Amphibalanus amphitrite]